MTEENSLREGYILAGLPGAGKSTVTDIMQTLTDGGVIEAGSMIREMARQDGLEDPTSAELGEYAASQREESGGGFFGEQAVGMLLRSELNPDYPIIIDSVRHIDGLLEFREYFDTSTFVWVHAYRPNRLGRLQDRGRDDEAQFDMANLLERDGRELEELGVRTLLEEANVDARVTNNGTVAELREQVEEIVRR